MWDTSLFDIKWRSQNKNNEIELDLNFLFQQTEQDFSELLLEPKSGEGVTDGTFTFIENLTENLQVEFDESVGQSDSDKRQFIKSFTKIFAILLNTMVDSIDKIKKIIKQAISTVFKIWPGRN